MNALGPNKAELMGLFTYDRKRGVLIWKYHWRKEIFARLVGKVAGTFDNYGYRIVRLNGRAHKIHRIIWFLETGEWSEIDHIDGDPSNNKFSNLRASTKRSNSHNRKRHRLGKLVGATYRPKMKKWQSRIWVNGKSHNLGLFDSELEAHTVYKKELASVEP